VDAGPGLASPRNLLARFALAAAALALAVWFVVLAINYEVGLHASVRLGADPNMSAAEWQARIDDLERARLLDPSTDWTLIQAQFLLLREPREAIRVADDILRREPDNLGAWLVVAKAARGVDRRRWREAMAEIRRLDHTPAARQL
jgi:hypothetical protein